MIGLGLCKNVKDVSIVVDVASITATYYHFDSSNLHTTFLLTPIMPNFIHYDSGSP